MRTVGITEAKRTFEVLVDEVSAPDGRPVVITRRGRPVAVLIGYDEWLELHRAAGLPVAVLIGHDQWQTLQRAAGLPES